MPHEVWTVAHVNFSNIGTQTQKPWANIRELWIISERDAVNIVKQPYGGKIFDDQFYSLVSFNQIKNELPFGEPLPSIILSREEQFLTDKDFRLGVNVEKKLPSISFKVLLDFNSNT